jgi:hypothetical protein
VIVLYNLKFYLVCKTRWDVFSIGTNGWWTEELGVKILFVELGTNCEYCKKKIDVRGRRILNSFTLPLNI